MSIEHRETTHREPIIEELNISSAWDKESIRDLIIERLKALRLYQQNLLFRACDGDKMKESDNSADALHSGYTPLTSCKDALLAVFLIK